MPLRDHFHPPFTDRRSWDEFHGQWPAMIVVGLNRRLPARYVAAPLVHLGSSFEVDVAAFDRDQSNPRGIGEKDDGGGIATAIWAPPKPTRTVSIDSPEPESYEVRVYDEQHGRRLVAAIEIVSPANKDRPDRRHAFVTKCAALLQDQVCVVIVDIVTSRAPNLYADLMEFFGQADPSPAGETARLSAVACRRQNAEDAWRLEAWAHPLEIGEPLPTLPLWLAEDLAIPLDLEASYEETCQVLRIV
jgi:hypothetical protein